VGIIVTGGLTYRAIVCAKALEAEGIKTKVMNLSSIKPIDKEGIIALAKETHAIVTVEEHQTMGGMGSAVAEVLAQNYPVAMEFIGIQDKFGQSGTPDELIEHYGMGVLHIAEAVKRVLKRK
jgi:transketolase